MVVVFIFSLIGASIAWDIYSYSRFSGINFELTFLLLIALIANKKYASILYCGSIIMFFFKVYHESARLYGIELSDLLSHFRAVKYWSYLAYLTLLCLLCFAGVAIYSFGRWGSIEIAPKAKRAVAKCVALILVVLVSLDIKSGVNFVGAQFDFGCRYLDFVKGNVVASPVLGLLIQLRDGLGHSIPHNSRTIDLTPC